MAENSLRFEFQTVTRGDSVDQKWSNMCNPESSGSLICHLSKIGPAPLISMPIFHIEINTTQDSCMVDMLMKGIGMVLVTWFMLDLLTVVMHLYT